MKSRFHFSIQFPGTTLLWKNVAAFANGVKVTGDESKCPTINAIAGEYRKAVLFGALEARRIRRLEQQRTASQRYRDRKRAGVTVAGPNHQKQSGAAR